MYAAFFAPEAEGGPDSFAGDIAKLSETATPFLKRFGQPLVFAALLQYNGWTLVSVLPVKQAAIIVTRHILAVDALSPVFSSDKLKALWAIVTGNCRDCLQKPFGT